MGNHLYLNTAMKQYFARSFLQLLSNCASVIIGIFISAIIGFSGFPQFGGVVAFFYKNTAVFLLLCLSFLAVTSFALYETGFFAHVSQHQQKAGSFIARFLLSIILSTVGSTIIGMLLGITSVPDQIPLFHLFQSFPPLAIVLVIFFLCLIIFSPYFAFETALDEDNPTATFRYKQRLFATTSISMVSVLLFTSLLGIVLARPTWCPISLCLPPQVVVDPFGRHDQNLELTIKAIDNTTYEIPGPLSSYTFSTLPREIAAQQNDPTFPAYRIALGLHSLQRNTTFGITIDHLIIVIDHTDTVPDPLNVWEQGRITTYDAHPYIAVYRGDTLAQQLDALSKGEPLAHPILAPGEGDQADIEVQSRVPVLLTFHVIAQYHVTNQQTEMMLKAPGSFKVVFSTASNWHLYQMVGNQFVPAS